MIVDKQVIADKFNEFFSSVGEKIVRQMPSCDEDFRSFLPNQCPNSMFFQPISFTNIFVVVQSLKDGKSSGHDGIDVKVFKKSIYLIIDPLCNVLNLSLEQGVFPHCLKIARVVPIFKKGHRHILNNYRPISILSVFF